MITTHVAAMAPSGMPGSVPTTSSWSPRQAPVGHALVRFSVRVRVARSANARHRHSPVVGDTTEDGRGVAAVTGFAGPADDAPDGGGQESGRVMCDLTSATRSTKSPAVMSMSVNPNAR